MNTRLPNALVARIRSTSILTVITGLAVLTAAAGEPDPQDLRATAERLQRQAQELKEQGQSERAGDLMRQAEELRAHAEKLRDHPPVDRPDRPGARELRAEMERAKAQLEDLGADGKAEQALMTKRHIQELQMELERLDNAGPNRVRPLPEPRPERGPEGLPPGPPQMERLHHLEVAIDNLHAAGMHELADRLARQVQTLREQRPGPGPRGPRGPGFGRGPEVRQLQAEVDELRQAVRDLARRVEEMSQERK